MELVDPAITLALARCGAVSVSDADDESDYLRFIDGYSQHRPDDPSYQRPLAQIGGPGFRGCRRDQFLEELAKAIPPGVVEFGKRLARVEEKDNGRVALSFVDGTATEADAGTCECYCYNCPCLFVLFRWPGILPSERLLT